MEDKLSLIKLVRLTEEKRVIKYIDIIKESNLSFKDELLERLKLNIDHGFFKVSRDDRNANNGFKLLFDEDDNKDLSFEDTEELKKLFCNHYSKRNDVTIGFFDGVLPDMLSIMQPQNYEMNIPFYSYINYFSKDEEGSEYCKITKKGENITKDFNTNWNIRLFSNENRIHDYESCTKEMALLLKESDDEVLQEFIDTIKDRENYTYDFDDSYASDLLHETFTSFSQKYSTPDKLRKGLDELKDFKMSYIKINKDKEKVEEVILNEKDKPILDYINDILFSNEVLARDENDKPINVMDEFIEHTFVSLLVSFFDSSDSKISRMLTPMVIRKAVIPKLINKVDFKYPTLISSDYYSLYHLNIIICLYHAKHLFFDLVFKEELDEIDGGENSFIMSIVEENYNALFTNLLKLIATCVLYSSDNLFTPALDILPIAELMPIPSESSEEIKEKDNEEDDSLFKDLFENMIKGILPDIKLS